MKKLYRKGTVHPSPQIKPDDHLLSLLLPAAILSLAAALSPEDREVLAYLISTSGDRSPNSRRKTTKTHKIQNDDLHPPLFHCDCFSCYTSYWVRWDSSPSRQLIHEIIDAFEDSLEKKKKERTGKKDRRKRGKASVHGAKVDSVCPSRIVEPSPCGTELGAGFDSAAARGSGGGGGGGNMEEEKGSVRRFVSFLGEKFLGVWG
ncbi:PREDICTED: uncharacterized protein LOC104818580 [Tarenaya hassleriana]|uniref:uncharacterized protein LOC104818580 n=1 Tax=Tarenaya hassleriana TaxID=28532 RepID=UPI00053CA6E9|nr:PREDICTED: uncharacterized protein LOC104818580 [Tarenaya hassleriana]